MTRVIMDRVSKRDAKELIKWWNANTPHCHKQDAKRLAAIEFGKLKQRLSTLEYAIMLPDTEPNKLQMIGNALTRIQEICATLQSLKQYFKP